MRRFAVLLPLCLVAACSSKDEPVDTNPGIDSGEPESGIVAVPEWDKPITAPADDDAAKKRGDCAYGKDTMPAETQGKSFPMGKDIPIDTIVITMMENRSFDHYFQKLKDNGWTDVDVAPADFSNPDKDGNPVTIFRDTRMCFVDTNHEWKGSHEQVNVDKMDGFVKTNEGWSENPPGGFPELLAGKRAMGYYDKPDLPFMYWAAENFAIGDKYFCSLQGPTWPNRMYLYAASSFGRTTNKVPDRADVVLFDLLEKRGVDWAIYATTSPGLAVIADRAVKYRDKILPGSQFAEDARAGKLPHVVFLDPSIGKEGYAQNDEHPPAIMQVGQKWLSEQVKAFMEGPQWAHGAFFLTYDEHGGLYDHVVPPKACEPDDKLPESPVPAGAKFDHYGIRVPFVAISPYAKKKHVSHHVYDHTSIVRFVEARWTLPAMTKRDANAEAPWDMFDFAAAPQSPPTPPAVTVDEKVLADCKAIWVK